MNYTHSSKEAWHKVSTERPCPACGKTRACEFTNDGWINCVPGNHIPAGYEVHRETKIGAILRPIDAAKETKVLTKVLKRNVERLGRSLSTLGRTAAKYAKQITKRQTRILATDLGVSRASLRKIGVGWDTEDCCFSFPEHDADGNVIGIARRYVDGTKGFVKGGHRGLVVPQGLDEMPDPVLLVEGASDVAAAMTLGITAVGRPSASGGAELAAELLRDRDVIVMGENDRKPEGLQPGLAARDVAQRMADLMEKPVRWALPPHGAKDVRAWLTEFATDDDAGEIFSELTEMEARHAEPQQRRTPIIVRVADVKAERLKWLWPERIPVGKLSVIAGDPDLGKSLITIDMTARITRGRGWPDATNERARRGDVIMLSAEDDVADTIRPRLEAAGADLRRVIILNAVRSGDKEVPFNLIDDLPALERAIEQCKRCRLISIDPISSYLGVGRVDSHRNDAVRGVLAPLAALAARHRIAVVCVNHLSKSSSGGPALYRIMGSLAFSAAARTAWGVTKDKEDESRRLFLPVKNNLSAETSGLAYTIDSDEYGRPYLRWEAEPVNISADEAMSRRGGGDSGTSAKEDAVDWLRDALADGPVLAAALQEQAEANGLAWATVRRAKMELRVQSGKLRFDDKRWFWALPDDRREPQGAHQGDQGAQDNRLSTLADSEHLGSEGPTAEHRAARRKLHAKRRSAGWEPTRNGHVGKGGAA